MTNEKAIELLTSWGRMFPREKQFTEIIEAYGLAVQALGKQVPQKFAEAHKCPTCGETVYSYTADYCEECGQRLDWRKDD